MQEPQYRSPGVRELLDAVAKSHGLELTLADNAPGLRVTLRFPVQQARSGEAKIVEAKAAKKLAAMPREESEPGKDDSATDAEAA